jgi:hypothetical protein
MLIAWLMPTTYSSMLSTSLDEDVACKHDCGLDCSYGFRKLTAPVFNVFYCYVVFKSKITYSSSRLIVRSAGVIFLLTGDLVDK